MAKKNEPLIKIPAVVELVQNKLGLGMGAAREVVKAPQFPKPAIDANRKSRWWRRTEVEAFLEGGVS